MLATLRWKAIVSSFVSYGLFWVIVAFEYPGLLNDPKSTSVPWQLMADLYLGIAFTDSTLPREHIGMLLTLAAPPAWAWAMFAIRAIKEQVSDPVIVHSVEPVKASDAQ